MLKYALILLCFASVARAQVPTPLAYPQPDTPPPPLHVSPEKAMKYKEDMKDRAKHSRAGRCVQKIKDAGLEPTPENIAAQCEPIFQPHHEGPHGPRTMNELLGNPQ